MSSASMWQNPVWRLRMIGIIEGFSYIALLGIAMPLKYLAGMPLAVRIAGSAHGFLFVLLMIALLQAWIDKGWSLKMPAIVFIASLLPFGTFAIDGRLKKEQAPT